MIWCAWQRCIPHLVDLVRERKGSGGGAGWWGGQGDVVHILDDAGTLGGHCWSMATKSDSMQIIIALERLARCSLLEWMEVKHHVYRLPARSSCQSIPVLIFISIKGCHIWQAIYYRDVFQTFEFSVTSWNLSSVENMGWLRIYFIIDLQLSIEFI